MKAERFPQTNRLWWALLALFAALFVNWFNYTKRIIPSDLTQVSGVLMESSTIGSAKRPPTPRFTLSGNAADFRIDPRVFRDVMPGGFPADFIPGAKLAVLVDKHELASPAKPPLNPQASVIWVNGLTVNGRRQFGVPDVSKSEATNDRWGLALLVGALAFVAYATISRRNVPGARWQGGSR